MYVSQEEAENSKCHTMHTPSSEEKDRKKQDAIEREHRERKSGRAMESSYWRWTG